MPKSSLIILSSGFVNPDLIGEMGRLSTSRIPVSNSINIILQIDKVLDSYESIYVWLNPIDTYLNKLLVEKYRSVSFIEGDPRKSVKDAIQLALEKFVTQVGDKLVEVIFGDTVWELKLTEDHIGLSESLDRSRWMKLNTGIHPSSFSEDNWVFTGQFSLSSPEKFLKLLKAENESALESLNRTFKKYYGDGLVVKRFERIDHWNDLGHLSNYYSFRRDKLKRTSRVFNSLEVSSVSGYATKSSSQNHKKIEREIAWFRELPREMKVFVPELIAEDVNPTEYKLRFINTLTVAEAWIAQIPDDQYWYEIRNAFSSFLRVAKICRDFEAEVKSEKLEKFTRSLLVDKFIERINDIAKNQNLDFFVKDSLWLNGIKIPNLLQVVESAKSVLEAVTRETRPTIMHGDLIFANALYDRRAGQMYFIDPRGCDYNLGVIGDTAYELAKLAQCVFGGYDFIIAGAYAYSLEKNLENVFIDIQLPDTESSVCFNIMRDFLQEEQRIAGIDSKQLEVLWGSLMISAAPLHSENLERQIVMIASGMNAIYGATHEANS